MNSNLTVSVSHKLGKLRAKELIEIRMEWIRSRISMYATSSDGVWHNDDLTFQIKAIGQTINGMLKVEDKQVQILLNLPWIILPFKEIIKLHIQQDFRTMFNNCAPEPL
jgi:hypothetical protein